MTFCLVCDKIFTLDRFKYNLTPVKKKVLPMARLVELGLTLKGEEAREFLKNEKWPAFTTEQLAFFRQAKTTYKENCSKF